MMRTKHITKWIELIELSCADLNINHIDIIVDQSGNDFSLIPTLTSFESAVQWCSLFKNLPEEALLEESPLLIRIDLKNNLQRHWLNELATEFTETGQLLVLCSTWTFSNLFDYLNHCINIICANQAGIFRFYDTRVFPLLMSHVLTAPQKKQLLRPGVFWSWMDRDSHPHQIIPDGKSFKQNEKTPVLELSDEQYEKLMCICDANLLLRHFIVPDKFSQAKEKLFLHCYEGMLAATDNGLLMDDLREEFVKKSILEEMKGNY